MALIQSKLGSVTSAGSNAVTFDSTPTAGNLIIVAITYFGGGSDYFSTLSDNKGNTYTQVGTPQHANATSDYVRLYYAKNISSSATFTITATFTGSPGSGDTMVACFEYSGMDTTAPLDVSDTNKTGSSSTPTSNSITPTQNGELIFMVEVDDNGGSATASANSPFTFRLHQDDSTTHERINTADYTQPTAGSISGSFNIGTSSNYAIAIAAFKAQATPSTGLAWITA